MQWTEIPQDWMWTGDPEPINAEIRAQKGRRKITWDDVADTIGIKRQALARRLQTTQPHTPWRHSELRILSDAWGGVLNGFLELHTDTAAES